MRLRGALKALTGQRTLAADRCWRCTQPLTFEPQPDGSVRPDCPPCTRYIRALEAMLRRQVATVWRSCSSCRRTFSQRPAPTGGRLYERCETCRKT